ncbi:MAG: hypothetical protein K0R92_1133 [Lachnospiraceae bacterium]|jgi:hypothetical protein|nr:hypothetical protein [Lachnospiraceae bacterium]
MANETNTLTETYNHTMNDIILKKIETMKGVYYIDPNRILQDFRKETAEIEGYHGRELLELLQNAVDEIDSATKRYVCIELSGNKLRLSNNGSVFSEAGITSLMYSNLSPKHNSHKYIGNKGTGFRSVLNWANCVRIYSGDLSIEFSTNCAEELLNELLTNDGIKNYKVEHSDLKVATLVAPKPIIPLAQKEYDTVIEIDVKDEMLDDVHSQIEKIDATTLLFLNKLERLTIIQNEEKIVFDKISTLETEELSSVIIKTYVNEGIADNDEWMVACRTGQAEERHYAVSVAYKTDMSVKPDVLFSYFKTQIEFPVPALVHGTFDLSANRNHLNETHLNKIVLEEACRLLIDTALQIDTSAINYAPLRLLSLKKDFPTELAWTKIDEFYHRAIAESKVFPTVNSKYISFFDNPKFFESKIADYVSGVYFSELLLYSEDVAIRRLINKLVKINGTSLKYEYDVISKGIDSLLLEMNIKERAALCIEFLTEYNTTTKGNIPPKFIIDSDNRPVNNKHYVFLPPETKDGDFPQPPKFASLVYMQKGLLSAFRDVLETNVTLRALSEKLSVLNVREYNLTEIIRSVISKLNNREHKDSKKTQRYCVETLLWLWKISKIGRLQEINLRSFRIPVVARDGKIRNADVLYLGKEYGNEITENLFESRNDIFVAAPQIYGLRTDEIMKFSEFLLGIGIAKYPRIIHKEIRPLPPAYRALMIRNFDYPLIAEDNVFQDISDMERSANIFRVDVEVIEHYEDILEKAETKKIIAWLRSDERARSLVTTRYEQSQKSTGFVVKGNQVNGRRVANDKISSFMRYEFSQRLWIEVSSERYSVSQCLLRNGIGELLLPYAVEPDIDSYITNLNQPVSEKSDIRLLLTKIGAAETFADLSTNALYGILLTLPSFDETGEISKALYQSIIDTHGLLVLEKENANYKKFMESGMVYCKNVRTFINIHSALYLTEKTVSKEVLKNFNLIAIPSRQSQETIKKYLGVKSIKLKGTIVGTPSFHTLDSEFVADFNSFKVYAFCYRIRNAKQSEIASIKSIKVRLCDTIEANYNGEKVVLDDYSFIRGNESVYIKSPVGMYNMEQLRSDLNFCATMAEVITSTVDIQDDKLFLCLRSLYGQKDSGRQKLILQDFDDLEVLAASKETLDHIQSRQEMFLTACEQIGGEDKIDAIRPLVVNLNFEDINNASNIEALLQVLKILEIDVPEFNDNSEFFIDLRGYYTDELKCLVEQNRSKYKNRLFASMIDKSIDEQKYFLKQFDNFLKHKYSLTNTKSFDVKNTFFKQWPILSNQAEQDADVKWKEYRDIFSRDKDAGIIADLLADFENDSLLYFGAFDELTKRYDLKVAEWKKRDEKDSAIQKPKEAPSAPMEVINVSAAPPSLRANGHSNGSGSRSAGTQREYNKALWGAFAEEVVYRTFTTNLKDVKWVSENAKKKGVNPEGIGGLGYDLTYVDENGETIYVEIKSTVGSSITFMITDNELSFAEKKHLKYEIALVTNIDDESNRKIHRLQGLFTYQDGESRYGNSKFSLSSDDYSVCCVAK